MNCGISMRIHDLNKWQKPWFPVGFPLLSTMNGYDSLMNMECRNPLMWVKQCHKPPLTRNGKTTTYKNGVLGDGLLLLVVIHSNMVEF